MLDEGPGMKLWAVRLRQAVHTNACRPSVPGFPLRGTRQDRVCGFLKRNKTRFMPPWVGNTGG